MKRYEHGFRTFLVQSFARFRKLSAPPDDPSWERVLERLQEEPEGASESAQAAVDSVRPIRPIFMSRPLWVGAGTTAMVVAVILSFGLLPVTVPAAQSMEGELQRFVEGKTLPLAIGEAIQMNDIVQSEGGSGGTLKLADGSRVEMRSKSELMLEKAADGVRIRLRRGGIIVNAARQRTGHLYVQTKEMTVSVVGTVFLVNAEEAGSRVAVIEGEVRVQQGALEKSLKPGEQVTSNPKMESLSVKEEVLWSRKAVEHVALLEQATTVPAATLKEDAVEFEVATVKVSHLPEGAVLRSCRGSDTKPDPRDLRPNRPVTPLGRCVFQRAKLTTLIAAAYSEELRQFTRFPPVDLVTGGPTWKDSEIFDIEGKATNPSTVTERELYRMLQSLLVERFKLQLHRDSKDIAGYALVVAQDGPKFVAAKDKDGPRGVHVDPLSPPGVLSIQGQNISMSSLAQYLSSLGLGPVADKTQLQGTYDLVLTFGQDGAAAGLAKNKKGGVPAPGQPGDGPTVFKALEQQLGLRLVSEKLKFEFLVLDSAQKPGDQP